MALTKKNVRAFLDRDWDLMRRVKDQSVSRFIRENGTGAAFKLEQMMLDQVWARLRLQDGTEGLTDLIALRRKLDRASAVRR